MFVTSSWQTGAFGKSDDSQGWPRFGNRTAEDGRDQKAECGRTICGAEPLGAIHFLRQSVAKLLGICSEIEDRRSQDAQPVEERAFVFAQRPVRAHQNQPAMIRHSTIEPSTSSPASASASCAAQ